VFNSIKSGDQFMKKLRLPLFLFAVLALILVACGPVSTTDPGIPGTGDGTPAIEAPPAVQEAIAVASAQVGVAMDRVQLVDFEQADWPDACLGVAEPNEMCAQVITPGYRVMLQIDGQTYEFRTDQTGTQVRQAQ
jgi:hypothetical protein